MDNGALGVGFGSGINGELKSGLASFVEGITTPQDLQRLTRCGILYDLAYRLFSPAQGVNGVSEVAIIRAGTTTAGTITFPFVNGTLVLNPLDEGTTANGEVNASDVLSKGFGVKMAASPLTAGKYVFGLFVGQWKGIDGAGLEIGLPKSQLTKATLIVESPEVGSISELVAWTIFLVAL